MEPFKISLAAARVEAGLSKKAAAEKLEVTVGTITRWEKRPELIRNNWRKMISMLYGVPLEHIRFN